MEVDGLLERWFGFFFFPCFRLKSRDWRSLIEDFSHRRFVCRWLLWVWFVPCMYSIQVRSSHVTASEASVHILFVSIRSLCLCLAFVRFYFFFSLLLFFSSDLFVVLL